MKKYLLLLFVAFTMKANAQWINSLTVYPTNPTMTDSVYLIAQCSFPSGSCDQHTQGFSQNGFTVSAWALHCVGMLAFICGHTDTFSLGILAPGVYTASFNLNHGAGPFPCTPGIVSGPTNTITFNVSSIVTTIPDHAVQTLDIGVYPNPANDKLYLNHCDKDSEKKLFTLTGQLALTFKGLETNVAHLKPGVYLLKCEGQIKKVVIE